MYFSRCVYMLIVFFTYILIHSVSGAEHFVLKHFSLMKTEVFIYEPIVLQNSKSLSIWTNFKIQINYTQWKKPTATVQVMFNRLEQIIDINNASSLIKLKSFLENSETNVRHFINASFKMWIKCSHQITVNKLKQCLKLVNLFILIWVIILWMENYNNQNRTKLE